MTKIEVFDPPMCCTTGVCGPEPETRLSTFAGDLKWLQGQGVTVRRFNLAQEPAAFVANVDVKKILEATDGDGLPVVMVDGQVASQGVYPSRERLMELAGVDSHALAGEPDREVVTIDQPPLFNVLSNQPEVAEAAQAGECCGGDATSKFC